MNQYQRVTLQDRSVSTVISEDMKLLRTNLQFCGVDKKVVLFTSSLSGEGKSTLTFEISKSMTELGKRVLLIDADLRASTLLSFTNEFEAEYGLSHFLSAQSTFSQVLTKTDNPLLDMIFCGTYPPNPTELLANERFAKLLEVVKEHYDYVFIDCAPLGMVVDAAVVAPLCDGAVVIVESGKIRYHLAQDVIKRLQLAGCPILGVIFNKVESSRRHYNNYYYHKRYGNYYGKNKRKNARKK